MTFAFIGLLGGLILSLRHDVLILGPVVLAGWLLTFAAGLMAGEHIGSILIAVAVVTVTLQVGFIAGIAFRGILGLVRSSRRPGLVKTSA
jgi:hypothetical protein